MSEELEMLRYKRYVAERKLTAAKYKEKRLQSELKRLTRSERNHRLCTHARMLEPFLKEPTVLTDEDVMELVTFIFYSEAFQKKLNLLIESRKATPELEFPDETTIILLNTTGTHRNISPDIKSFFDYVNQHVVTSDFTNEIDKEIFHIKSDQKARLEYMSLETYVQDNRYEAYAEGKAEGLVKGFAEGEE